MYNDLVPETTFEVRICESCGLRYPLVESHPFGTRCPACMGETRLRLRRRLVTEPVHSPHSDTPSTVRKWAVVMDNVRSAWNVGSILRSADGFGFSQAYLCGITPTPDNQAVTKTSLGAEDSMPWSYHKDAVRLVKGLKRERFGIHALEEHERATDIRRVGRQIPKGGSVTFNSILVVGNEISGVDPELLDLCDNILFIPMRGDKKSFNVAIAFSIAAYALSLE